MRTRVCGNANRATHVRDTETRRGVSAATRDPAIQSWTSTVGCCRRGGIEKDIRLIYNRQLSRRSIGACVYRAGRPDRSSRSRIPWEKSMKRTAQEIADFVGGELRGSGLVELQTVASLRNAGPNDLSYAEEKFRDEVGKSRAGCVIVRSGSWPSKTLIIAANPKRAFARAAAWLLSEVLDDVGIHPSATV